jgi:hypothetical protein
MKFPRLLSARACCLAGLIASLVALNVALGLFSVWMYPVQRGAAEEFWDAMYGLGLSKSGAIWGVYPPQDGLCVFYSQGFHGQFLHAVPMAEAERLLPAVRQQALDHGDLLSAKERQLLSSEAAIHELVQCRIETARELRSEALKDGGEYDTRSQKAFLLRWDRIRRYPRNILFEAVFLNGWLVMLLIPFLKREAHGWRALSAGLAVPVFMTPYFLGYCPWSFTSAGPVGGVVYPTLLVLLCGWRISWNPFDEALLRWLPSPLQSLSQEPGDMMSVSGMGGLSPTWAIMLGWILALATWWASRAISRRAARATAVVRPSP